MVPAAAFRLVPRTTPDYYGRGPFHFLIFRRFVHDV
jgi:hypothetical protein